MEIYKTYSITLLGSPRATRFISNFANMQNILVHSLHPGNPDLVDTIYSTFLLNIVALLIGRGQIPLIATIPNILPQPSDHKLEVFFITEVFNSWRQCPVPNPKHLINKALGHFEHFDDDNVKGEFSSLYV